MIKKIDKYKGLDPEIAHALRDGYMVEGRFSSNENDSRGDDGYLIDYNSTAKYPYINENRTAWSYFTPTKQTGFKVGWWYKHEKWGEWYKCEDICVSGDFVFHIGIIDKREYNNCQESQTKPVENFIKGEWYKINGEWKKCTYTEDDGYGSFDGSGYDFYPDYPHSKDWPFPEPDENTPVDAKVWARDEDCDAWVKYHYAGDINFVFDDGTTSWSNESCAVYDQIRLANPENEDQEPTG